MFVHGPAQSPTPLLEFSNPVFHDGVNLTVRRGRKWLGERYANVQLGGGFTTNKVRLHTKTVVFSSLVDADVLYEHDPSCRTVEGLARELKRVYPEFSETDEVTLVTFILEFTTPQIGDKVYHPDMIPFLAGNVEDVIPLNDNFYEIAYSSTYSKTMRCIVHVANFVYNLGGINENGWFNGPHS